ncbi:hypothetical protein CY34DRAFT_812615 [Suillus luteus UH-Slu-Lm8-n1]|uniref:Uncharacterized protein n=1 Tax=Suillus luteus UH-Slu-Lm8-n1 TaxID=930992 RepID=A0A0D0AKP6_9AGAM|nr:hypothetical protein CY34DRAFT_812615 [Suillus luteus UH-Slu-Lm8-n1]
MTLHTLYHIEAAIAYQNQCEYSLSNIQPVAATQLQEVSCNCILVLFQLSSPSNDHRRCSKEEG